MRPAFLVASVLVVAGCSGAGAADPTLAPGPTATAAPPVTSSAAPGSSSSAAPSTTVAVTASTVDPAIPFPQTQGEDDVEAIWRELIEYHNWAFQNPDLADASVYISEECECYANAIAVLDEYREKGWREVSEGLIVDRVDIDVEASTFALLTVVDEHSPLVVVDGEGNVVRERDRRPKTFWDIRLRLIDDSWLIVEWFQRGAVGDAE